MRYKNPYYNPHKSHHTPRGFQNPEPLHIPLKRVAKWLHERWTSKTSRLPEGGYEQFIQDWMIEPDFSHNSNFVTWLGHCTLYFKLDDIAIITDPVFSERASFLSWVGPKRQTPVLAQIEQLPYLHYVLISHEHYDHLD